MAVTVFAVNGTDYTSYLARDGLAWSRNDLDAAGSGRDKQGTMRRRRVATKVKLGITCRTLSQAEVQALNAAISGETVSVTYLDPRSGAETRTFYGSEVSAGVCECNDSQTLWRGVTFNLIEV